MHSSKQLVVKFGTEVLLGKRWRGEKHLDQKIFNSVAAQITRLQSEGVNVTIVSSGAIQAGRERISKVENNIIKLGNALSRKKELAGIGSRHLLNMWGRGFMKSNREIAQLWVTFSNLSSDGELQSISSSISNYHELGIVPIVNENDVVSDSEIKLMDRGLSENDCLARMIAKLIDADSILFITKSGGVFDEDPAVNPSANKYLEIDAEAIAKLIGTKNSTNDIESQISQGGISAKLKEALHCYESGMRAGIAGLDEPDAIYKFAMGETVGTLIGNSAIFTN